MACLMWCFQTEANKAPSREVVNGIQHTWLFYPNFQSKKLQPFILAQSKQSSRQANQKSKFSCRERIDWFIHLILIDHWPKGRLIPSRSIIFKSKWSSLPTFIWDTRCIVRIGMCCEPPYFWHTLLRTKRVFALHFKVACWKVSLSSLRMGLYLMEYVCGERRSRLETRCCISMTLNLSSLPTEARAEAETAVSFKIMSRHCKTVRRSNGRRTRLPQTTKEQFLGPYACHDEKK